MTGIDTPRARSAERRLVITLLCAASLLGGPDVVAAQATHTVVIEDLAYKPAMLVVKRGDTIVWTNRDPYPHTVTDKGVFDSHSIAPAASWRYKATKAGEFTYTCTFHPNMVGTLRVE